MTNGQIALLLFLPLVFALFTTLPVHRAAGWTFLLGGMFLAVRDGWNPPLLPPIDKSSMTVLAALVACLVTASGRLLRARPGSGLDSWILVMALGGLGTALTNGDPVRGAYVHPALGLHDSASIVISDLLAYGIPFFLGRALFDSREKIADLLRMLAIAGCVYGLLALFEVRMSPQLHRWIYGYVPTPFFMAHRLGGFRPLLFMQSGIAVGEFFLTTVLAAFTLRRVRRHILPWVSRLVPAYLAVVLVACKSLGAIVYGVIGVPIVARLSARKIATVALVLAAIVVSYPALRLSNLFPTQGLVSVFRPFNAARAASLGFRFDTEERLMERERERPLFGWGGFDRYRVDEETGKVVREVDGFWLITMGQRGAVGLSAALALLLLPVFTAWRRIRREDDPELALLLAGLAFIVAVRGVDLLPNTLYGPLLYFLAGALYAGARSAPEPAIEAAEPAVSADAPPAVPPPPRPRRLADLLDRGRP